MRLPNRALTVTIVLLLILIAAACSSNEPASPAADGPTEQQSSEQEADPTPVPAPEEAPQTEAADALVFTIDPAQSEARFIIDEELMGSPKTVIGANNGVQGQVTVDPGDPASVVIGPIGIDAASFVTDSGRRNGAINRFILQSSSYPTITFTPTGVEGVPATAAVGDTLELQVTGDLTIREVTRSETFAVTVEVVSENELRVNGATEILRDNYDLTIPNVPSVANVTNEVQLEFDFVATAQ